MEGTRDVGVPGKDVPIKELKLGQQAGLKCAGEARADARLDNVMEVVEDRVERGVWAAG